MENDPSDTAVTVMIVCSSMIAPPTSSVLPTITRFPAMKGIILETPEPHEYADFIKWDIVHMGPAVNFFIPSTDAEPTPVPTFSFKKTFESLLSQDAADAGSAALAKREDFGYKGEEVFSAKEDLSANDLKIYSEKEDDAVLRVLIRCSVGGAAGRGGRVACQCRGPGLCCASHIPVLMDFFFQNVPQIIQAIFFDDKSILECSPNVDDINYKDPQLRTPLHAAAHVGDVDFVEFLLSNNARVNVKDIKWYTPLHRACASDAPSVVQLLLDNGADRNMREKGWLTPLHVAAYNGSLECARLLLFYNTENGECGTNVNASDRGGHTPLHHAVYGGHLDIMDLLCEFGAEVNCRDKYLYTPLHVAAALGHVNVAKQLMARGAELDAVTARGNSALHTACLNGSRGNVKAILEMLAKRQNAEAVIRKALTECNSDGYSALHLSIISPGGEGCLEELISFSTLFGGKDQEVLPNSTTSPPSAPLLDPEVAGGYNSWTPLHLAAVYGRNKQIEMLLQMKVNLQPLDRHGNTPLHLAAGKGHELVLNTLLAAGAPWNAVGNGGATPLHCAAASGYSSCLSRLLEAAKKNWDEVGMSIDEFAEVEEGYPLYVSPMHALKDDMGRNLVHAAALGGSIECLRSVLFTGGGPFEVDRFGRTALHFAILSIALTRRYNTDEPPIHVPMKSNSISEVICVLLKLGIDPDAPDVDGCTALHLASAFDIDGHIVKLLLRHGADRYAVFARQPKPHLVSSSNSQSSLRSASPPVSHQSSAASSNLGSSSSISSILGGGLTLDDPVTLPTPDVRQGKVVAYYPIHLAAAMGNSVALELLLQGMTKAKVCQVVLDSAKMTKYFPDGEEGKAKDASNSSSWYFYSPLFLAAFRGRGDCVEMLLNACEEPAAKQKGDSSEPKEEGKGAEDFSFHPPLSEKRPCTWLTDPLGRTLLHYAAHAGHLETCQMLVMHHLSQADPAIKDGLNGWTAVHHAAARGHCPVLQFLLHLINVRDENGRTPLMLAAQYQRLTAIHFLTTFQTRPSKNVEVSGRNLDAHIVHRVNISDKMGRTALHRTAVNGQTEGMKILLEAGASLTAVDIYGRQALHMAACSGQVHSLSYICDALQVKQTTSTADEPKAEVIAPLDARGFTPLHLAVYCNRIYCVRNLLRFKAYQELLGNTYTPLHCAAAWGDATCLTDLLKVYPPSDLKTRDVRNSTPLHIAAMANKAKPIRIILDAITDAALNTNDASNFSLKDALSLRDVRGCTPLMAAARTGSAKAFSYLIEVHLNVDDDFKMTLLNTDNEGFNILHQALCAPTEKTALSIVCRPSCQELFDVALPDGRTPLHLAVSADFANVIVELLKRGANVFHTDALGKLPIYAVAKTDQSLKCLLVLLYDMMPQLSEIQVDPLLPVSRTFPDNPMADSIRSSDPEFY
ncbi:Serine/threonine-protein phosphatase 6 regulatory ankyrin repeat subunit B [Taenia solium]|eukprot:TsM_001014800 transcript=TsM_001014800 gene=TsM_001014800